MVAAVGHVLLLPFGEAKERFTGQDDLSFGVLCKFFLMVDVQFVEGILVGNVHEILC